GVAGRAVHVELERDGLTRLVDGAAVSHVARGVDGAEDRVAVAQRSGTGRRDQIAAGGGERERDSDEDEQASHRTSRGGRRWSRVGPGGVKGSPLASARTSAEEICGGRASGRDRARRRRVRREKARTTRQPLRTLRRRRAPAGVADTRVPPRPD